MPFYGICIGSIVITTGAIVTRYPSTITYHFYLPHTSLPLSFNASRSRDFRIAFALYSERIETTHIMKRLIVLINFPHFP
jgi:hypothetical protein